MNNLTCMPKDFDNWNLVKKSMEFGVEVPFRIKEAEIWWCKLGLNVGVEIDGKNIEYDRPVLVIKRFNEKMFLILPLTRTQKSTVFHYKLSKDEDSVIVLSQVRVVSNKRLVRRMGSISQPELLIVKDRFKALI